MDDIIFSHSSMDQFEDAKRRNEPIHIRYQKRNNKSVWSIVEGIDAKTAKNICKQWKTTWGCGGSVKNKDQKPTILLTGDHRGKISKYLKENKIADEEDIKVHGPELID